MRLFGLIPDVVLVNLVHSDQRGIQEKNNNFPGAEIHAQTGSLHTKTYFPDEGQRRCRGEQAEVVPGKMECACSLLFHGRLTHTHFAECVRIAEILTL